MIKDMDEARQKAQKKKEAKEASGIDLRFGSIAAIYYEIKGEKLPNQMELLECFFPGLVIKTDSSDGNTKIPAEYRDQECMIHAVRYKGKLYAGESKRVSQILGRLIGTAKGNQEKERKSAEQIQKHVAECFVEDMELTPALQENIRELLADFSKEQLEVLWQSLMDLILLLTEQRRQMSEEERKGELFALDNEVFDDILYNAAYQLNLDSYSGLCNAYLWFLTGALLRNETGRVLRRYDSHFIAVYRQGSETNQLEDKLNYLFHPEDYEDVYYGDDLDKRFPGIEWYCDECDAYLNEQEGFVDYLPYWECRECGYFNRLEIDEIYEYSGDFDKGRRLIDPVKFADALERRRQELEEEKKIKESLEIEEEMDAFLADGKRREEE